jgi:DNA-binding PadR family transcriptional regulator
MGRRFFAHGELPLVLLTLLEERPMHGYELMTELARLFAPHYRPSPGSIYPALDALDAERLVTPKDEGGARVYGLTSLGQEALDKRRDALAAIELRTGVSVGQRGTMDAVLARFALRVRGLAGRVDPTALDEILDRAARDIEDMGVVSHAAGKEGMRDE